MIPAGILASQKKGAIIKDVIKKFIFFHVNYNSYNQKYTSTSFPNRASLHGWLSQMVINEAVYSYCFKGSETCNDVRILSKEYGSIYGVSPKDIVFLDADGLDLAYIIKVYYNKNMAIQNLLDILANSHDTRVIK